MTALSVSSELSAFFNAEEEGLFTMCLSMSMSCNVVEAAKSIDPDLFEFEGPTKIE